MNLKRLKTRDGFTLVEVSIVLLIAGLIIAGIYIALSSARFNNKVTDAKRQMTELVSNTKDFLHSRNISVGNTTDDLITTKMTDSTKAPGVLNVAGVLPADTLYVGTSSGVLGITTPYNDSLYIPYLFAPAGATRYQLFVHMTNVPKDACYNIGTIFNGQSDYIGLSNTAGGNPVTRPNIANLQTLCGATLNELYFKFLL